MSLIILYYNNLKVMWPRIMDQNYQELKEILKELQSDMKQQTEKFIELSTLYKHHNELSVSNARRIDALESDSLIAKGSIGAIKLIGSVFSVILLSSSISFCTWVVSSQATLKQNISDTNKEVAVINSILSNKASGSDHERQR